MPSSAIPLEDTSLVSEFDDIYNGTPDVFDLDDDPLPVGDYDYIYLERPAEYGVDAGTLLPGDYRLTPSNLVKMVLHGKATVLPWKPNTNYVGYREHYNTGLGVRAPDIVFHDNSLYFCLMDFQSGETFSVIGGTGDLQLSRLTLDTDLQYLELTGNIKAPILAGDEVLTYALGRRSMIIRNEYLLPDPVVGQWADYRKAVCNGDITTTSVFNINRLSIVDGLETVGTITFEPDLDIPALINGVFDITDTRGGGEFILMRRDEVLIIEAVTVGMDLAWVRLNILGEFMSYRSPYHTPIEPGI